MKVTKIYDEDGNIVDVINHFQGGGLVWRSPSGFQPSVNPMQTAPGAAQIDLGYTDQSLKIANYIDRVGQQNLQGQVMAMNMGLQMKQQEMMSRQLDMQIEQHEYNRAVQAHDAQKLLLEEQNNTFLPSDQDEWNKILDENNLTPEKIQQSGIDLNNPTAITKLRSEQLHLIAKNKEMLGRKNNYTQLVDKLKEHRDLLKDVPTLVSQGLLDSDAYSLAVNANRNLITKANLIYNGDIDPETNKPYTIDLVNDQDLNDLNSVFTLLDVERANQASGIVAQTRDNTFETSQINLDQARRGNQQAQQIHAMTMDLVSEHLGNWNSYNPEKKQHVLEQLSGKGVRPQNFEQAIFHYRQIGEHDKADEMEDMYYEAKIRDNELEIEKIKARSQYSASGLSNAQKGNNFIGGVYRRKSDNSIVQGYYGSNGITLNTESFKGTQLKFDDEGNVVGPIYDILKMFGGEQEFTKVRPSTGKIQVDANKSKDIAKMKPSKQKELLEKYVGEGFIEDTTTPGTYKVIPNSSKTADPSLLNPAPEGVFYPNPAIGSTSSGVSSDNPFN